ncbi:MAG: DUF2267 domain-containing protein [Bacteroidota bacterium]
MAINFKKYAEEGDGFVKKLSKNLGHPDEIGRSGSILRAVLHTIRERITMAESLNLIAQFPMFLKALYVDGWKFREQPVKFDKREFLDEVKKHQDQYGETEFNWEKSTEEIVTIVLSELRLYISEGEYEDIMDQLPDDLKEMFLKTTH